MSEPDPVSLVERHGRQQLARLTHKTVAERGEHRVLEPSTAMVWSMLASRRAAGIEGRNGRRR